jgi:hypothetical protein
MVGAWREYPHHELLQNIRDSTTHRTKVAAEEGGLPVALMWHNTATVVRMFPKSSCTSRVGLGRCGHSRWGWEALWRRAHRGDRFDGGTMTTQASSDQ